MGGGGTAEVSASPANLCSLKDGSWLGMYLEDGNRGFTKYFLFFKPVLNGSSSLFRFSGQGEDEDGAFRVEAGVYGPASGRLVWTERSRDSDLVAECTGEVKNRLKQMPSAVMNLTMSLMKSP